MKNLFFFMKYFGAAICIATGGTLGCALQLSFDIASRVFISEGLIALTSSVRISH